MPRCEPCLLIVLLIAAGCGEDEEPRMDLPDVEAVARGREMYGTYGCGTCHGREGRGDGPVAKHLDPRPRDFRDEAAFRKGTSISEIMETLRLGLMEKGKGMPGYPHLSEAERWLLAKYVTALRKQEE